MLGKCVAMKYSYSKDSAERGWGFSWLVVKYYESEILCSESKSTLGPLQSMLKKLWAQRWILLKHFQNYLDKKFWVNQNQFWVNQN